MDECVDIIAVVVIGDEGFFGTTTQAAGAWCAITIVVGVHIDGGAAFQAVVFAVDQSIAIIVDFVTEFGGIGVDGRVLVIAVFLRNEAIIVLIEDNVPRISQMTTER